MPIRLKVVRRKEEQISKVKGLMDMFNVNSNTNAKELPPIPEVTCKPREAIII
jgi:hypothetical protein